MIYPLVPRRAAPPKTPPFIHLPDAARSMGMYILASRGAGKSRILGRVIAWQDCLRGVPQVIWDAAGGLIDNFLDKVRRLPVAHQAALWPRIRYVEMSGRFDRVTPWPFFFREPGDTLYECAQRYLEVVRRLDPHLVSASVQGWNALAEVGTAVGMGLTALGAQITEAEDMLTRPEVWRAALAPLCAQHPELTKTTLLLATLAQDRNRETRTRAFLQKVAPFSLDPTMRAMFGASQPGLDWAQVVADGETVLLDFRHELDNERRRLKMLWAFQSFVRFIKRRGAGRHTPVGLVIDELTTLYQFDHQQGSQIFAADLDELINVVARNYGVWLTVCHQELFQVDVKTFKTLMGMGTKIIGVTQDREAALRLAQELFAYDPARIKHFEPIYAGPQGQVVDLRPLAYSIHEQQHLAAELFMRLRPFHFLVKPALGEGDVTGSLHPLTIANLDRGIWVDEAAVGVLRHDLLARSSQSLAEVLVAVNQRRAQLTTAAPAAPRRAPSRRKSAPPPAPAQPPASTPSAAPPAPVHYERDPDDFSAFRE